MRAAAASLRGYRRLMARELRFEEPDGIYHVGSRGNNGEMMFRDEIDRMEWLRLFAKVAAKYRWVGWTYVLMGNHFHFLVQIPHGGLSRGMQMLNTGYSVRTNKRHGRTGHLVRNRFYSGLVEDDVHLMEAIRYIVLTQSVPASVSRRRTGRGAAIGLVLGRSSHIRSCPSTAFSASSGHVPRQRGRSSAPSSAKATSRCQTPVWREAAAPA